MIRHGEKPPKDANGDDVNGLSVQGMNRAQGLRQVFGASSQYNIGYVLAEHPKKGLSSLLIPSTPHTCWLTIKPESHHGSYLVVAFSSVQFCLCRLPKANHLI